MKSSKKTALFIQIAGFSHTNDILVKHFQKRLDILDIDVIDVWSKYIQHDFINLASIIYEYRSDILKGKYNLRTLASFQLRTRYIFHKIKSKIAEYSAGKEYVFTFQTQSLFDASVPGIPHFLYTDHTRLVNSTYPGFPRELLPSAELVEMERSIYQNATLNFTMSENVRQSMIDHYAVDPGKVKCVYAGCNAQVSAVNNPQKYTNKNILFVGLDWPRKGGPQLVQAFKKVLEKCPDATLTIVGANPEIDVPNCSVIGLVPVGEVSKYYEQASIFCMPTRAEPFGIVFLEAMSNRLPVVATNIGAIPEFVHDGESGFLVAPNEVDRLAERLIDLLGNPGKCQEFGEKGYEIVQSKYTWEKTSKAMVDYMTPYLANHFVKQ